MNYETYAPVTEKAKEALLNKKTVTPRVQFADIRISEKKVEMFRFVTKARRKIMRRLGL